MNNNKAKYEQLLRKKIKLEQLLRAAETNVKKIRKQIKQIEQQLRVYA